LVAQARDVFTGLPLSRSGLLSLLQGRRHQETFGPAHHLPLLRRNGGSGNSRPSPPKRRWKKGYEGLTIALYILVVAWVLIALAKLLF
jgi:hypothetical protein